MTISYSGNSFRLLLRWKGSIWRSVWRELFLFLILFYSIRFSAPHFFNWADPDETKGYRKIFKVMCNEFHEYTKMIPLTFLLGFYVSNVVSRWWRQFECLKWPEDFLSILCLLLPSKESRPARHQIARYLNLTCALAWRDVSTKIRLRFPSLTNIIDAGLLTEKEYEKLQDINEPSPGIRWLTPLHWVQQLIDAEIAAGRGSVNYVSVAMNELKAFRISFRRLYCHDWVCVPLVYTQVAALATYSYFFFCLFGRQDLNHDDFYSLDAFFPLFTVVQFLFFVGWFKVGQDLMRPFGLDDDDFELSYILDRNIVTSFTIVDSLQDDDPPKFEEDVFWKHHSEQQQMHQNMFLPKVPSSLKWGRIDLSRNAHKHPPKLHTYLEMKNQDPEEYKNRKNNKFIAW
ncbi:hypothetical protein GCK72_013720 [Caenorhabditis remanei]|uniref:Bestrophin homolog n=1 Tax=Caenorhabditis remanei TaxID=31234 RepID=E3N417_CAERE|nr:hypothetical protein GCK72_013720 [Caenorhabditis remanei]EFO85287.1 hypothetical protein CRE_24728 [Caenorhabditis remanei]KAF1757265.1 hypothetical protein GCK72_013720 [Caenorhabditis remanei]